MNWTFVHFVAGNVLNVWRGYKIQAFEEADTSISCHCNAKISWLFFEECAAALLLSCSLQVAWRVYCSLDFLTLSCILQVAWRVYCSLAFILQSAGCLKSVLSSCLYLALYRLPGECTVALPLSCSLQVAWRVCCSLYFILQSTGCLKSVL